MSTRTQILSFVTVTALIGSGPASAAADHSIHARATGWRVGMHQFAAPVSLGRQPGVAWPFGPNDGPGFGSALVGSAPTGNGPSTLAIDSATHTIYVANGNNDNGPNAGGATVSVIDTRRCQADDVSHCKGRWPTITVGNLPSGIAIDERTDTVYVTSVADDTVSVFNGATCDASITSGCGQTPAKVPVGLHPIEILADPANHTVYVANYGAPASADRRGTAPPSQ